MKRKLTAVAAAGLLCSLALPALPAAALSGTAALVQGADVLPGAARAFSVEISNSDPNALLGGEAINGVLVQLPAGAGIRTSGTTFAAPAGWTVERFDNGPSQSYLFSTTGSGIAPGGRLAFPFLGDVNAPASRDQKGAFKVSVSNTGGSEEARAAVGALTSTVRILDVVETELKGLAPAGVTDGSGTAGQTLDFGVKVVNHARNAVVVTPSLASNGSDTFGAAKPLPSISIPAGGAQTFAVPTTLGGTADRAATFRAGATAADSAAVTDSVPFEVQAPARLSLAAGSLSPSVVRQGKTYTFTANATKVGKPSLTGLTGSLSFAGNTIALASPDAVATGDSTPLTFAPSTVTGADGKYDVDFSFAGADGNGHPYSQDGVKLLQAVTLDALAPVLTVAATLPTSNGVQQTAAKNGDRITISGALDEKNCDAALDFVELRTDNGQVVTVPVTKNGCTFSGSVSPAYAAGARTFTVVAQATDAAGNPGTGSSLAKEIDNIAPDFTYAQTRSATEILVRFTEGGSTPVIGGCSTSQWKVDGDFFVRSVLNSDGTPCSTTAPGPDNDRVLVLAQPKDQDFQTNVTYTPRPRPLADPAKDGAAADALSRIVKTVVGIAPAPAVLTTVTRNAGAETAVFDEGRYFTRFGGSDLQVTFSGARAGYKVQVLDGSGQVLRTTDLDQDGTGTTLVPLGTTPGVFDRQLRLVNTAGLLSTATPFKVELDQLVPSVTGATLAPSGRDISVLFNEKLAAGTDAAFNWEGWARDSNPDSETGRVVSPAEKVSGSGNTRTVTIQDTFTAADFGGADYIKRLSSSLRYEDRAGNQLANTL